MKPEIVINLLTPLALDDCRWGDRILQALVAEMPALTPAKYGNHTPLSHDYDVDMPLQRETWRWPFTWKSRSPLSEGTIWPQLHDRPGHANVVLRTLQSHKLDCTQLSRVLQVWAAMLRPDIAFIDFETEAELARRQAQGRALPQSQSWTPHQLRRALPDLAWTTIFGPPYVALIGRDRLLSAPVHRVIEDAGLIHLQLSPDILDLERDPQALSTIREGAIDHLGRQFFLGPDMARFCAPTFDFGARGQLPPRADPEAICAALIRDLSEDVAAGMALPQIRTVDQEDQAERVVFMLEPVPADPQVALLEVERRLHNRALGCSAFAIARAETDSAGRPIVTIHARHESGHAAAVALALPFTSLAEAVAITPRPFLLLDRPPS